MSGSTNQAVRVGLVLVSLVAASTAWAQAEPLPSTSPSSTGPSVNVESQYSDHPAGVVPSPWGRDPYGDYRHMIYAAWDMALPVGSTWDHVDEFSVGGISLSYRYHVIPRLGLGASVGWNSFSVKRDGTFQYDAVTITGTQVRQMDVMSLMATANVNILPIQSFVVPFIGLDLGADYLWRVTDFGWWTVAGNEWQFSLAPSLGAIFHLPVLALVVSTKFHVAFGTEDGDTEMYTEFNIGLGFN